jgi:predicted phosphodiesterase
VSGALTRIISDLHFGERACRVNRLDQLRPLLNGVDHLVLNGDTLDTRAGPRPADTAARRSEIQSFFAREVAAATLLSGNHDADFSPLHDLDLADGSVFVTHGDVFFDDIVPWSRDAPLIRQLIAAEFAALPGSLHGSLPHRHAIFKRVAASIPQRHQSEQNLLKYALHYLVDSVWPPHRLLSVLRAWRHAPILAAEFCRRFRPRAGFVLSGHTHRPGIWPSPRGVVAINTGSLCPPLGGYAVDLLAGRLLVRELAFRVGEVRAGAVLRAFPLAGPRHLPETET